MKMRIIAAVVLLPLLLIVLLLAPTIWTVVLFSAVCGIGAYELLWGTGFVRKVRPLVYTVVVAALVPVWCYMGCDATLGKAGLLVFFCLLFMEMMLSRLTLGFDKLAVSVFGGLVIPYMLSSLVRIGTAFNGRYFILIPFVVAFMSDSGAYFVGCAIGKHKMAPVISPKKSWEGFFGGLTAGVVGMIVYVVVLQFGFGFRVNYLHAAIYGLAGALAGVFGDLCFSVIKRQTGIKDYGNLIPGHGGVLDRFDSIIVVAPLIELLLHWFPVVVK
ncbi:MAG: phosphatidate cytidylyltransferase [Oscillospiraceae bacterium]|nr:phosphatidate cytidylyltransferase [Oscillospiraceae bacterium]